MIMIMLIQIMIMARFALVQRDIGISSNISTGIFMTVIKIRYGWQLLLSIDNGGDQSNDDDDDTNAISGKDIPIDSVDLMEANENSYNVVNRKNNKETIITIMKLMLLVIIIKITLMTVNNKH